MDAKFDQNDDFVVVVIGSGAGGGTLSAELAMKGVKVVCLEAGKRNEIEDFLNDEWASFVQLAWTDTRTTSGSWRVHKDFANFPPGSSNPLADRACIGRALRCVSRSTNSRPRLITAKSRAPIYWIGRSI